MEEMIMKSLKYLLTCFVLFMLGLSMLAQAQTPLGQWTFEPGNELKDLAKNFGDIKLNGGATVVKGVLNLDTNMWAITTGYTGPDIKEKTMVAWLYLDDLEIKMGAPIAINKTSGDAFDAITYAERQPHRFFPGSSNFSRTEDPVPGFEEKETGKLIQLAVSYENSNNLAHIRMYRNGDLIGDYTKGNIATWTKGDVEAIFGPRAVIGGTAYGWIKGRVSEARLYGSVLTQAQVKALSIDGTSAVVPSGKLATLWGTMKAN
jgi:hypothetical protein